VESWSRFLIFGEVFKVGVGTQKACRWERNCVGIPTVCASFPFGGYWPAHGRQRFAFRAACVESWSRFLDFGEVFKVGVGTQKACR
jgi:hypothetical protein